MYQMCIRDSPNSYVSGVVCIRVVPTSTVFLFKCSKTIVLPVEDFVLRGMEEPIYVRIAKRLYHPGLLPLHAQLVGLRVLSEAESTSTIVDSPFTTVFAMTHGMFISDRNTDLYVKALANVQHLSLIHISRKDVTEQTSLLAEFSEQIDVMILQGRA